MEYAKGGLINAVAGVGGVYVSGAGTLLGLSFDKVKWPSNAHQHLRERLLSNYGISVYSDGAANMIMIAPPYTMNVTQLNDAFSSIGHCLRSLAVPAAEGGIQ